MLNGKDGDCRAKLPFNEFLAPLTSHEVDPLIGFLVLQFSAYLYARSDKSEVRKSEAFASFPSARPAAASVEEPRASQDNGQSNYIRESIYGLAGNVNSKSGAEGFLPNFRQF